MAYISPWKDWKQNEDQLQTCTYVLKKQYSTDHQGQNLEHKLICMLASSSVLTVQLRDSYTDGETLVKVMLHK